MRLALIKEHDVPPELHDGGFEGSSRQTNRASGMIVLADATPLNYVILIDHTETLPKLFKDIFIPTAVVTDCSGPEHPRPCERRWLNRRHGSRVVQHHSNAANLDYVGAGEREAIFREPRRSGYSTDNCGGSRRSRISTRAWVQEWVQEWVQVAAHFGIL